MFYDKTKEQGKDKIMGLQSQFYFDAISGKWKKTPSLYNDDGHWITVHPSGKENPDDYRHVKVEEGETAKEAIDRKFGKDKKEPEKKINDGTIYSKVYYSSYNNLSANNNIFHHLVL